MTMKTFSIAVALVIGGMIAGQALGGFAIGSASGAWDGKSAADAPLSIDSPYVESGRPLEPSSPVEATNGPERYSCRGCGPGIAERRMRDSYGESYAALDDREAEGDRTEALSY